MDKDPIQSNAQEETEQTRATITKFELADMIATKHSDNLMDDEDSLYDIVMADIQQLVEVLSAQDLINIVWQDDGIDGDLIMGDEFDQAANNGGQDYIKLYVIKTIEQQLLEKANHWGRRSEELQRAKARAALMPPKIARRHQVK